MAVTIAAEPLLFRVPQVRQVHEQIGHALAREEATQLRRPEPCGHGPVDAFVPAARCLPQVGDPLALGVGADHRCEARIAARTGRADAREASGLLEGAPLQEHPLRVGIVDGQELGDHGVDLGLAEGARRGHAVVAVEHVNGQHAARQLPSDEDEEHAAATDQALRELTQAAYEHLARAAVAGRVTQPARSTPDAHGEIEILRAAFLVRRANADPFLAALRSCVEGWDGVRCEYSGPWAPYSFAVPIEEDTP